MKSYSYHLIRARKVCSNLGNYKSFTLKIKISTAIFYVFDIIGRISKKLEYKE